MSKIKLIDYPFIIRPLLQEEGEGYVIEYPDLPGCMSDGATIEETITNGKDAVQVWIDTAKEMKKTIPKPSQLERQSGKWVQRVPKSIHLRLVTRAKEEGVSLNTLVIMMLSEALSGGINQRKLQQENSPEIKRYKLKDHDQVYSSTRTAKKRTARKSKITRSKKRSKAKDSQ